jgi:ubiquinone/menaquinone biosynthesis C-methylase UbiE
MSNEIMYMQDDIVSYYANTNTLRKPEKTILHLLSAILPKLTMLDIGVGGGRTTNFFAPLTKKYAGIDYSKKMVALCKQRFQESSNRVRFALCDVRKMTIFEDDSFDFILFSLNGLDSLPSHEDRLHALREIHRVGKTGGYFCFSSHNLQHVHTFLDLKRQFKEGGIKTTIQNLRKWMLLRFVHNSREMVRQARCSSYTLLKDGIHEYRLMHYWIRPSYQLEQLANWFYDVEVYSATNGARIENLAELDIIEDAWLYYLCRIK